MVRVALKGVLSRPVRAVLTALAIVLGVAMVSGTYILTDTIQKAFTNVFTSSYQHTSVIISGKTIVKNSANPPAVPARLLSEIVAMPDVAAAAGGFLFDPVSMVDQRGKTIGGGGAPTFGFGIDPTQPRFNPLTLVSGRWATGPDQIVIDTGTAAKHGFGLGNTIGAKSDGPIHRYTIVGTAKIAGVSIGGATMAVLDVPAMQALLDKPGQFDAISAVAKPGVSQSRLAAEIKPLLPPTVQVKTSSQEATSQANDISHAIRTIRYFLLAFGGIALFVGAFVIFNTISITIAQRTRELATLRTLGASRRQVLWSVMIECLVVGVVASVIGLFAGLLLARGLNAVFVALGADLPQTGTVFATRTVWISILVGVSVTLLSGVFPAVRATRIPPIAAVREGAALPPPRHPILRPLAASVLIVLGLAAIAQGLFVATSAQAVLAPLGAGTLMLFLGVALISSQLVPPIARVVGYPARWFGGGAGRLAAANAVRNPARTASTAAALMIGLALVSFVAILAAGLVSSDKDALNKQLTADYVVSPGSNASTPAFPTAAGTALRAIPGVTTTSNVRTDVARVFGADESVDGVDPAIPRVVRFEWVKGADGLFQRLGNGAIVPKNYASAHHLAVGSPILVETSAGTKHTFIVKGIYDPPAIDTLFDGLLVSQAAFDRTFPRPKNGYSFADAAGGISPAATARMTHRLAAFPDAHVQTRSAFVDSRAAAINTTLDLFYVLLGLSIIVSLFGMINTLILSVFERTREIGMLRAIGMTRRQLRRMIRHESIITALIGAALGLPLGLFLAAAVTRALSSQGVGFHLPVTQLVIFTIIAVVAGTLAAVLPARRAARLDVLAALQYE